jgi:Asp-tRNA(Asn)/Glu-tRNA(Gln) amidotransferase A subunit family amidase
MSVADPSAAIADALEHARLVADGGGYVRIFPDEAVAAAAAQAGDAPRAPLAGVTLAVKDLFAVAGQPIGAGSASHDDAAPEPRDAAAVAALRALGAVPVGLAALHEIAFGVTGVNAHTGTPANPAAPGRVPGGSSGGSAVAVATGSSLLALGTDTGGSVRIPAALCGVVGFKPAYGEYPTDGVLALSPTLDHVGLLAADVTLVRRAHAALGYDPGVSRAPGRVGFVAAELDAADAPVRDAVLAALARLRAAGAEVAPCPWPEAERGVAASTLIMLPEAAQLHRSALAARPECFGDDVRRMLEIGARIDQSAYAGALRDRARLRAEVARILDGVDVVVGPTVGMPAPLLVDADRPELSARLAANTSLLNVVGVPAVSVPIPGQELPVGLQVIARSSAQALGAAAAIEELLAASG